MEAAHAPRDGRPKQLVDHDPAMSCACSMAKIAPLGSMLIESPGPIGDPRETEIVFARRREESFSMTQLLLPEPASAARSGPDAL